jgi:MFS family permease
VLLDVSPLLRRDFRLLFIGQLVSFFGTMMTSVAVPYQVWTATHSAVLVGALSVAQLVPLLATALVGGALADAMDRRKLLLVSEALLALVSGALAWNALAASPSLGLVFGLSALSSAVSGFHRPALDALTPRLVPPEEIPASNALAAIRGVLGMVGGPAAGGLAIATLGLPATYLVDAATFAVSLAALAAIRSMGAPEAGEKVSLSAIRDGLRYAASRQELIGMYAVDFVAMIFGMPTALLPAMADRWGGAKALGWLTAAPAVGALLVNLVSGFATKVHRHGAAIAWAAAGWGLAIVAFGLTDSLGLALVFLALAGAADMVSALFRLRVSNETVPDHLRGRIGGLELISYLSGPFLGNAEAGLVAGAFGVRFSVVSGGVLCVAGVGLAVLLLPRFRRYDARDAAAALSAAAPASG